MKTKDMTRNKSNLFVFNSPNRKYTMDFTRKENRKQQRKLKGKRKYGF